ncbi:MAG: hypothetical protein Q4C44_01650 [bacterium]|nr:hypothetical protein [bacterium]
MKIVKELICLMVFVIGTLVSLDILGKIFIPKWLTNKDNSHTYISKGFYDEKENSLDVLFLGNSDVYRGVSPIEIYKNTGIASYNYVASGERIWTGYYLFLEALESQSPSVIVLNVDGIFSSSHSSFANYRKAFDNMRLDKNKVNAINDEAFDFNFVKRVSFYLPIFNYHSRYSELNRNDFKYAFSKLHNSYKGLDMTTVRVAPRKTFNVDGAEISDKAMEYLNKIKDECAKRKIKLVLMWLPSLDSYSIERGKVIADYAYKNSLPFLDLNINYKSFDLDFKEDSSDGGDHLNVYGAEKVSKYLGEYLVKNYSFSKHDKSVTDVWDRDVKIYDEGKKELQISEG